MSSQSYKLNGTNIYLMAWILAQTSVLLAASELTYTFLGLTNIRYVMYIIAGMLLFIKIVYFDKYKFNILLITAMVMTIVGIVSFQALGFTLILHGAFMVSIKGVNLNKVVKIDIMLRLMILLLLFFLAVFGVINNYSAMINGNFKYAFGWQHPNNFGYQIITTIVEIIYIIPQKMNFKYIFGIFITVFMTYLVCPSRTTIYSFAVFFVILLVVERERILRRKSFLIILKFITLICTLGSWFLVGLYIKGNTLALLMDSALSSRLAYAVRFINTYPIKLWGNKIKTVSTREHLALGIRAEILDMSYIRLALEYGVIFFLAFIILYIAAQIYLVRNQKYKEALIVLYFSLVGIASTGFLSPFSNFSLLFISFIMVRDK